MKTILTWVACCLALAGADRTRAADAGAADEMILDFEALPRSHGAIGGIAELRSDPGCFESGKALRFEPELGHDLGTIQFNWREGPGRFAGEGVGFWAKSTRQKVTMKFIISLLRPGHDRHATYSANFVVSNLGSWIVIPFSEFKHESGETADFPGAVAQYMTYVFIKYYQNPVATVYIDSLRSMRPGEKMTETTLGPPDSDPPDPDMGFTPGPDSAPEPPMICNFSELPRGYGAKGLKLTSDGHLPLIANPEKVHHGSAAKLEPVLGWNLSETQFNFRVPAGRVTGSGFKFWARSDVEGTVLDFIVQHGGAYATQIALGTTGRFYEVPFKDLRHRSGAHVNIGEKARNGMSYVFFKYFKTPISAITVDSFQELPFDANLEASNPVLAPAASSANPSEAPTNPTSDPVQENTPDPLDNVTINDPNWTLAWSDEFDGPVIDQSKWNWAAAQNRNSELGYFTDRPENSFIEDGKLVIRSLKENYRNLADYTSAELTTKGKVGFLYGKLEIFAKLPKGKGAWPGFWTLGEEGAWPAGGEIDIIEMLGGPNDGGSKGENVANGTLHWANAAGRHVSKGSHYTLPTGSFTDDYHRIGIIWSRNKIRWYIDDHIYREADITDPAMSEFRKRMYIILNTSIGGNWPGSPDESTPWPMLYYIDYVRHYTYEAPAAK